MNYKVLNSTSSLNFGVVKFILTMKLFLLLILVSSIHLSALEVRSQTISITLGEKKLRNIIAEIEEKTNVSFFFNDHLPQLDKIITISEENQTLHEILNTSLGQAGLDYKEIKEDFYVLIPTEDAANEGFQPLTITGEIMDETGYPVVGATIQIKGTLQGTTTDANGRFSIEVSSTDVILEISFIGMKTIELTPEPAKTHYELQMEYEAIGLQEFVAVGYGTQVKKNISSSITQVDVSQLASAPIPSFEGGLQGRAAGVQVTTSSALAGSAVKVRIRGTSSASANSEPLYVIDGIPVESGEISTSQPGNSVGEYNLQMAANTNVLASLNPADIESIEILKDAAAAAIYGSRGANGVVLITTRRGQAGKTKVTATANFGISDVTNRIDLLDGPTYIKLAQTAWSNAGLPEDRFWQSSGVLRDGLTQEQAMNTNTNWIDEILQIGQFQEYNLSASGGNENTLFFMSGNMKDETSILVGNHYKRYGARINLEHHLNDWANVGGRIMLTHIDNKQVPTSWAGGVSNVTEMLPIWPVYKEDGTFFNLSQNHPVAGILYRDINLKSNQMLGNWFLNLNLFKGFNFRTEFGANLLYNDDFHFRDGLITSHGRTVSSTILGSRVSWNYKNILNFKKRMGIHGLDVLAGIEAQELNYRSNTMVGDTYFNSALVKPSDAETINASYFETGYAFLSYIGRINYDIADRYLLYVTLRADGSSRFAEKNRWGYFPALSLGYIVSDESFFNPVKSVFNFLKLRASYGVVGNSEIGDYSYYSAFSINSYNGNAGLWLQNLGDDQLRWEKTYQLNLGISFEMLKGRIIGEIDYYDKKTKDLLLPFPVSSMTGVASVTKNVGELSNKGIDFDLTTLNIVRPNFSWESKFTLNHNRNKVESLSEELGEGLEIGGLFGSIELYQGHPVGVRATVEWDGVDPATGEDTYLDLDGNRLLYSEIIEQYGNFNSFFAEHKKPIGNPWPLFTGGINNSFTFNDLYLSFLVTYALGVTHSLGEVNRMLSAFGATKVNPTSYILDYWKEPGDNATVSKLGVEGINWTSTTELLKRTDYVRLKDVTLGYRFKLGNQTGIQAFNIYFRASNLLTWTLAPDYYWDPEFAGVVQSRESNNLGVGGDYKTSPQAKTFMLGLSVEI